MIACENTPTHEGSCCCSAPDASGEGKRDCCSTSGIAEGQTGSRTYIPAVDIIEGESEILLLVDLPGVNESGVDITLEKNVLTVRGKPAEVDFAGRALVYAEYRRGEYKRSFALSDDIAREGIGASIKDGVLTLRLPKSTPTSRKISVANG